MKKWSLFLTLYLCLCLLAACAASGSGPEGAAQSGGAALVCRVVEAEGSTLTLAGTGEDRSVYVISLEDAALTLDGAPWDPTEPGAAQMLPGGQMAGALAEVSYDGGIQESWPAGLEGVTAVDLRTDGFDDRCALYLDVLEGLWSVDEGSQGEGLPYIGVDLSQTALAPGEQAAVAWIFAGRHGDRALEGTYEELVEQGYITSEPLEDGQGQFWQWEDGVLFTIAEQEPPAEDPSPAAQGTPMCFDAWKWRSSLGAYYFSDCTAVQSADGCWDGYHVGSEIVS